MKPSNNRKILKIQVGYMPLPTIKHHKTFSQKVQNKTETEFVRGYQIGTLGSGHHGMPLQ